MLTGKLVRVRHRKQQIVPLYVEPNDPQMQQLAEGLLEVFRRSVGRRRGELQEELADLIPEGPSGWLLAGLAHLLEQRCTLQLSAPWPPEQLRAEVFALAAQRRRQWAAAGQPFDRQAVLAEIAHRYGSQSSWVQLDESLFADLKSEQRIVAFEDLSAQRLLERYNVALVQAVLLRATRLEVHIWGETPARLRQLFRAIKFHRLIAHIEAVATDRYRLLVDGPLSLFRATQKYGLQLALFVPTLLHCRHFELHAQLRWGRAGTNARDKCFTLSSSQGLRSHLADFGTYTPPELQAFVQSFQHQIRTWQLQTDPTPLTSGGQLWVPDYCLIHLASGRRVYLEFFGFWRRADVHSHYQRLQQAFAGRFLLCVGDGLRIEEHNDTADNDTENMGVAIYRYKRVPSAEEVARRAARVAGLQPETFYES